jgi:hypothetical protein
VNNVIANAISDTAIHVVQGHYSSVSGRVQFVGWRGIYTYKADYSSFDLDIHGSNALAIPSYSAGDPSKSTQDPVGAHITAVAAANPVYFKRLFITAYDSSNKWDVGIKTTGEGAVFGHVMIVNADDGIESDVSYQSIYGQVIMDGVTTELTNAWNENDWISEIIVPGAPSLKYATSDINRVSTVVLTTSQVNNLRATPIELIPAPGANFWIEFVGAVLTYTYAGSAFTVGADEDFVIRYDAGAGSDLSASIESTGFIDQGNNEMRYIPAAAWTITDDVLSVDNLKVEIFNTGAGETADGGTSTLTVKSTYRVHTTGL